MSYRIRWADLPNRVKATLNVPGQHRVDTIVQKLAEYGAVIDQEYIKTMVVFPDEGSYTMFLLRYS